MAGYQPEPLGLPLRVLTQNTKDDFGDSPRDHVFAQLDAGPSADRSCGAAQGAATLPPASRGRGGRNRRRQQAAQRASKGVEEGGSAGDAPALAPRPPGPVTPPAAATSSVVGSHDLEDAWPEGAKTVMLRNIQNRYTAEELLAELLAAGFKGCFDFFYLPMDFKTKRNRGFCFINFSSASLALDFKDKFHHDSKRLARYETQKIPEVSPAVTQGFQANVAQYVRKDAQRIQNPWFRPMIFTNDEEEEEEKEEEPASEGLATPAGH